MKNDKIYRNNSSGYQPEPPDSLPNNDNPPQPPGMSPAWRNNGGSAFPDKNTGASGMFLRDYFAAQIIQGHCASLTDSRCWPELVNAKMMVANAYMIADLMIEARND